MKLFLSCSDQLQKSDLYPFDAIEMGTQHLGLRIDELLLKAEKRVNLQNRFSIWQDAIDLMIKLDKLFASHPNHKLKKWVELARRFGDTDEEKQNYDIRNVGWSKRILRL